MHDNKVDISFDCKNAKERFLVDRCGEPAVIIMSVDDYLNTIAPEDNAPKAIRDQARKTGLDKLTMEEIDAEIAVYRREKRSKSEPKK